MNQRQMLPLRKYDLYFTLYDDRRPYKEVDSFEADQMVDDEGVVIFLNAGNVIRKYYQQPDKIIVTPVE